MTQEVSPRLEQANDNFDFAGRIGSSTRVDRQWACTAAFYAAVHSIHAVGPEAAEWVQPIEGVRKYSHEWDQAWVRANTPDLYQSYRRLRRHSQRSRYMLFDPTPGDVTARLREAKAFLEFAAAQAEG